MPIPFFEWPSLTDEERAIQDLANQVAREEIAPRAAAHDEEGTFVRDSLDALADSGLLGVTIPREYGGLGGSRLAGVIALDAVSAACGSTGAVYNFHLLATHFIHGAGPEVLRRKYLPDMAKRKVGALAFNEGGDTFGEAFETMTEDDGDMLVLNGGKPFVTGAGGADVYVFTTQQAGTGNAPFPVLEQEVVLVDGDTPGLSAPRIYQTMGLRGASNGSLKVENARVPKENVLGGRPFSAVMFNPFKDEAIVGPQVVSTGIAAAAAEAAIRHAREKGADQWKTQLLGTMMDRVDALRYMHWAAAKIITMDYEPILRMQLDMKLMAGEDAPWVCDRAIEIIGGSSVMLSSPVQRYYRDARVCSFLMFPMENRRERLGRELFKRDVALDYEDPQSMPWAPDAEFTYLRFSGRFLTGDQERARATFARRAFEEHARARGEDRVTLDAFADYLFTSRSKLGQGRPDLPFSGGGPPGGPPRVAEGRPSGRQE